MCIYKYLYMYKKYISTTQDFSLRDKFMGPLQEARPPRTASRGQKDHLSYTATVNILATVNIIMIHMPFWDCNVGL